MKIRVAYSLEMPTPAVLATTPDGHLMVVNPGRLALLTIDEQQLLWNHLWSRLDTPAPGHTVLDLDSGARPSPTLRLVEQPVTPESRYRLAL